MTDVGEPTHYEIVRSHSDNRLFIVCYADRFYEDVPAEIIRRGPWRSARGLVVELKPEIRLALARDRYFMIETGEPIFNTEVL